MLLYSPENISLGQVVVSLVKLKNKEEVEHKYVVWSYIYSGPVSYSGEREENQVSIVLAPFEEKIIPFQNKLKETTDKNLKLKFKILRDDRSVPYEITKDINLVNSVDISAKEFNIKENMFEDTLNTHRSKDGENKITSNVIYESSSMKLKRYSKYFVGFVILFGLFLLKRIK